MREGKEHDQVTEKESDVLDSFVSWMAYNIGLIVLVWLAVVVLSGKFEIIVNGVTLP